MREGIISKPILRRRIRTSILRTAPLLTLVGLFGLGWWVPAKPALAFSTPGINPTFNFQGRLLNAAGAVVADGTYNMQFKLYQGGSGRLAADAVDGATPAGNLMWTESWVYGINTPDNRVTVKNGYFSIPLGSICAFSSTTCTVNTGNAQTNTAVDFNSDTLWLSTNIGDTTTAATFAGASGDGEMLPMRRLASSVYALNAGKLGGLNAGGFIQNVAPNATQQTANINILSGAATSVAAAEIQTVASATAPVLLLKGGATPGTGADLLQLQNSASVVLFRVDSAGVIGSADVSAGATNSAGTTLRTGNSTTSGNTGDLTISTGTATSGNSGNISIDSGGASGTKGTVSVGATNASAITIGSAASATKVGIDINSPTNSLSVSPVDYQTGTVTRTNSSATLVGTGTTWASTMVGDIIVFADGTTNTVSAFTDVTHIAMGTTFGGTTDGSPVAYRFHKTGLQVTSTGTILIGTPSATQVSQVAIRPTDPAVRGELIQAATGQSVDLLDFYSSTGGFIAGFDSAANLFSNGSVNPSSARVRSITNSTTALTVQNNSSISVLSVDTTGSTTVVLGTASALTGQLTFANSAGANLVTLQAGASSAAYALTLPTVGPTTAQCLQSGAVTPGLLTFGACSGGSVTLQGSTPGTADTGNLNITGVAIAGTSVKTPLLDTASAIALNIGTTNATAINLNQNVAVAAGKTLTVQGTTAINSSVNASAFSVNGGVALLTADTSAYRVTIGTVGSCTIAGSPGKFCINQPVAGPGTTTNQNNNMTIANTVSGIQYLNVIGISDTSTAVANTTYGQFIDSSSGTNTSQIVNSLYVKVTANQPGSFLSLNNGAANVLTVANSGQTTLQNKTNSTSAFQIQNSSAAALFTADTTNERLYVGPTAGDTVGALLVLGNKTSYSAPQTGDPTGVAGGMYYNSALGSFRCYDERWHDCLETSRNKWVYKNEFMGTGTATNYFDGTMGEANSGGGASLSQAVVSAASHPGISTLSTGTGAVPTYATFWLQDTNDYEVVFGVGDYWRHELIAEIPTLSTSTERFVVRTGFMDGNATTDGTDGCFFKYSDNINGGNWQGVCINNTILTTCDTGTTLAASAWYRLEVVVNSAGSSADFRINGTSKCTISSGIPTGSARATSIETVMNKTVGTTNRDLYLDYTEDEAQFTTPR